MRRAHISSVPTFHLRVQLTYDTACGVASSDRYCANEFNLDKFRADIDTVLTNSGNVSRRETILAEICTPCFQVFARPCRYRGKDYPTARVPCAVQPAKTAATSWPRLWTLLSFEGDSLHRVSN